MRFTSALLLLVLLAVAGCNAASVPQAATWPAAVAEIQAPSQRSASQIVAARTDLITYSDRFIVLLTDAFESADQQAAAPSHRLALRRLRLANASATIFAMSRPNPFAGMMDLYVSMRLQRMVLQSPQAAVRFDQHAAPLAQLFVVAEGDLRHVLSRHISEPQLAQLDAAADAWRKRFPEEEFVAGIRIVEAARDGSDQTIQAPDSLLDLIFLDPLNGLDPAVRTLEDTRATVDRVMFYLQRAPTLWQWQLEGFYAKFFASPDVAGVLKRLDDVTAATQTLSKSLDQFDAVARGLPDQLSQSANKIIQSAAVETQRQRDEAVKQFASEVDRVRHAAAADLTLRVDQLRSNTLADVDKSITQHRRDLVADVNAATDRAVDKLTWRLLLIAAVVALLVFILRWLPHPRRK